MECRDCRYIGLTLEIFAMERNYCINIVFTWDVYCNEMLLLHKYWLYIKSIYLKWNILRIYCLYFENICNGVQQLHTYWLYIGYILQRMPLLRIHIKNIFNGMPLCRNIVFTLDAYIAMECHCCISIALHLNCLQ